MTILSVSAGDFVYTVLMVSMANVTFLQASFSGPQPDKLADHRRELDRLEGNTCVVRVGLARLETKYRLVRTREDVGEGNMGLHRMERKRRLGSVKSERRGVGQ